MEKKKVQIGLISVAERSFKFASEKIKDNFDPSQLKIAFDNSLETFDGEKDNITIDFGVKYFYRGEEILECIYGFTYVVENLKKYVKINADNSVKIDVIMPRMLSVALGTLRGIIIARTVGTPVYDCPLPMIDIEDTDN